MSTFQVDPGELDALRSRLRGMRETRLSGNGIRHKVETGTPVAGANQCGGMGSFPAAAEVHARYEGVRNAWERLVIEMEKTFEEIDVKLHRAIQAYQNADQDSALTQRKIAQDMATHSVPTSGGVTRSASSYPITSNSGQPPAPQQPRQSPPADSGQASW